MSKFKHLLFISLAVFIAIITYSLLLILVFDNHGLVFWTSLGFTLVSFVSFYIALINVLIKPKILKQAYLSEPYFSLSMGYLIIQFVFGIWSMMNKDISLKVILIFDILFLGVYLVSLLFLVVAITMNRTIDEKQEKQRKFVKELNKILQNIELENIEAKAELEKLLKNIRYISPTTLDCQTDIESEIINNANAIKDNTSDSQFVLNKINDLNKLLKKRDHLMKV